MKAIRLEAFAVALVLFATPLLSQQQATITGTVVNATTQQPLGSVQVVIPSLNVGTLSQPDGTYRLTGIPAGTHTLTAQSIGYRNETATVTVNPGGTATADFQLTEQAFALDAVVVTGTPSAGGTQRRAIGNDVSRVDVASTIESMPPADVQGALTSRAPGLAILPAGGQVGHGGTMRVRGVSSFVLGNEPIVYIDGVRMNSNSSSGPANAWLGSGVNRMNDINPADIESIEIIKGPAAATLYGTEASGGVIQIITKKGVQGRPSFDLSLQGGALWIQDPAEKTGTTWYLNPETDEMVTFNLYEHEIENGLGPVFQRGNIQNYNLNVRGGTEGVRYFGSVGWQRTEGIVDYNWDRRFNARLNLGVIAHERLDIEATLGTVRGGVSEMEVNGAGIMSGLVWGQPRHLVTPTRNRGFLWAPPEAIAENVFSTGDIDRVISSVQTTHRPTDWLTQRLTAGLDISAEANTLLYRRHPEGASFIFGARSLGEKTVETVLTRLTTLDYAATAEYDATPDLNLATSLGAQYYEKQTESRTSIGRVFPTPDVTTVGGAAVSFGNEDFIENKTFGAYIQEQIGWRNRVFLTAALRADRNSAFGSEADAALYPKFSGAWVVHEEPFWNIAPVSSLRLRAAWGASGRQPDVFAAQRLYNPNTGPDDAAVLTPGAFGNPELRPERGEEIELGFDLGLFNERVNALFTYYNRTTSDALLLRPLPPSEGFPGSQFVNAGEVKNWGTELQISARLLERRSFSWDLDLSGATFRDRIESLGGYAPFGGGNWQHHEGYPIGGFWWRQVVSAELTPEGRAINEMCVAGPDRLNEVLPCAEAEDVYWGRSATPTWEFGIQNTLTLANGLRLSARIDGRGGHYVTDVNLMGSHTTATDSYHSQCKCDPIYEAYRQIGRNPLGMFKGDFIKLRNVTASYDFPSSLISAFGMSRASLILDAQNLYTFHGAKFNDQVPGIIGGVIKGPGQTGGPDRVWDPELAQTTNAASGTILGNVPPLLRFTTTLRVSF